MGGLGNIGAGKYTPAQKIPKTVAEATAKQSEILAQRRLTYDAKRGIIKAKGYPNDHFDRKIKLLTADEDLKAVNPKFGQAKGYDDNCQRCVPTYVLRRNGFDVVALPTGVNTAMDRYLMDNPSAVWKKNGNPVIPKTTRGSKYYGKPEIESFMKQLPDGAMCEVRCAWAFQTGGHVFIAEKVNGKIRYIDPQTGDVDVSRYFSLMQSNKTTFWRIDDAVLDDDLIQYCCGNK